LIGAKDARTRARQPVDDLRRWLAEHIPAPDADQRDLRSHRLDEPIARRCLAAVMAGLEDANARRRPVVWRPGFEFRTGVSSQQQIHAAVTDAHDDRIVVA